MIESKRRDAGAAGEAEVGPGGLGLDRGEEAAHRRHRLDGGAGLQLLVGPGREGAAVDALDADLEVAFVLAGADRVAAAQLVVVEAAAEGQVLALGEVEERGVLVARLQGDDDGVAGLAADVDDIEGMEACHFRSPGPLRCT